MRVPERVQHVVELIDLFDIDVEEVWKSDGASPGQARDTTHAPLDRTFTRHWRFEVTTQSGTFTVEIPDRLVRQSPRTAAAMVRRATVHVVEKSVGGTSGDLFPYMLDGVQVSREEWFDALHHEIDKHR